MGIVPKVAVSYAGTYVVGNAVLQWYLTGRHLSAGQMRGLYLQAFARGKELARRALKGMPRLGRRKKDALPAPRSKALPAGSVQPVAAAEQPPPPEAPPEAPPVKKRGWFSRKPAAERPPAAAKKPRRAWGSKQPATPEAKTCPQCGKSNAADANFCQYCAYSFDSLTKSQ
jgi:hypothetical protein